MALINTIHSSSPMTTLALIKSERELNLILVMASSAAATNKKRERKYWTKEEDRILVEYIELNGEGKWDQVSKNTGLCEAGKTGNSCRMRWVNHLNPEINTGPFTAEEDETIIRLRNRGENKWSEIAAELPGRTNNHVKNRWNTNLSKDVAARQLLSEYINASDFNQFSLSDLYSVRFVPMNSLN